MHQTLQLAVTDSERRLSSTYAHMAACGLLPVGLVGRCEQQACCLQQHVLSQPVTSAAAERHPYEGTHYGKD